MLFSTLLISGFAAVAQASAIRRHPSLAEGHADQVVRRAAAATTCLDADAVQTGSASTGQQNDVAADGQSNSATDTANFINFCSGQTLTNGLQVKTGSCNGIVMGKIPATTNMVSTVILNPKLNDNLAAETTFNVTVNVANLQLGTFTNATSTYYSAPQDLAGDGSIIGHTHVTIQDVGSDFQFTTPLDATQFVFFKGINDAGNGQGTVTTAVTGGLPAGNYRVCTMSSSANHQPVLMPVAQRGAQDDCRYFTVGGSSTGSTGNTGSSGNGNTGSVTTSSVAKAATTSAKAATTSAKAATTSAKAATTSAKAATTSATAAATTSAASTSGSSTSSTSAIAGIAAPAVTDSGNADRPFAVNGDTFVNKSAAIQRACSIQNNACADAVNSGKAAGFTVADCNAQELTCESSQ